MSLIEDRQARMKALMAKPPAAAESTAGSNIVQFTSKPATAQPPSATPLPPPPPANEGEGKRQLQKVSDDHEPENQTPEQKKAAEAMKFWLDFAGGFVSFRDNEDAFYILHKGEALSLTTTRCSDALRAKARVINVKLTKDSIEQVQSMLREAARAKAHRMVCRRTAMDGDAHLIDLGDEGRHQARVDEHGVTIVQSGDAIFSRGKGYGELPMPVIPTDAKQARGFLDPILLLVPEPDRLPLAAVLVEWFRSNSPHPILILIGQEGSGKSTLAERITMVIDPSVGNPPRVLHTERAFYSTAQSRHIMLMDNLSAHLKGGLEDHLCCSSEGKPIEVPELYTTAESRTLKMFLAWIITGISNQITQADTMDRSWVIRVEKPEIRRSPRVLHAEFESARGEIFGALLFFLSERMRRGPGIEASHNIEPRMYDHVVTGESISQAIGHAAGEFIEAAHKRRAASAREWIKDDLFSRSLVDGLTKLINTTKEPADNPGNWKKWHTQPGYSVFQFGGRGHIATTADFIQRLVANAALLGKESDCIPKSAPAAANALDRIQNQMTLAGWTVRREKVNGGNNTIWVFGVPP